MTDRIVFIDDEPLPPITPSRSTMNDHDEHDIARMEAESPAAHRVDAEKLRAAIETIKGEDAAILDALAVQERDDDPVAEAEARTPNADEAPEA